MVAGREVEGCSTGEIGISRKPTEVLGGEISR